ncbi:MAG: lyase family protein, partial [Betaproteobacteria bacterium]
MNQSPDTRTEHDSFGPIEVPASALWGAQTQRALHHFPAGDRMPLPLIHAIARVKGAAARVNLDLGLLDARLAPPIALAADEVADGRHDAHFPLPVWQTGSGTQTNMNVNEVIANRAGELLGLARGSRTVHPNDHVNRGQSSNDVIPTAMHVALAIAIARQLLPALDGLRATLADKSRAFESIVKIGRTHLQDATPVTLGQEFSGYVAQLDFARGALESGLASLYPLAIGGTAVGTGLATHPEFGKRVAADLAHATGLPFTQAENRFAALAAHDAVVFAHGALKTLAAALAKIAN